MTPELQKVLDIAAAHRLVEQITNPVHNAESVAYFGGDATPLNFDTVKEKHGEHVAVAWVEFAQAHRHLLQAMGVHR